MQRVYSVAQHNDSVHTALPRAYRQAFSPCDALKFTTLGLVPYDMPVPDAVFATAWRLSGSSESLSRCDAVLRAFEAASLLKRCSVGTDDEAVPCVIPHDLASDLAAAMCAHKPGESTCHASLLARLASAFQLPPEAIPSSPVPREWWIVEGIHDALLLSAKLREYTEVNLIRHLLQAGGPGLSEARSLLFRLPLLAWLLRARGYAALLSDVNLVRKVLPADRALELLYQFLRLAARQLLSCSADVGDASMTTRVLAQELAGRVTPSLVNDYPESLGSLRAEACVAIDAGLWIGFKHASLEPPGGVCEAVLEGHTSGVVCLTALPSGKILSGSRDGTLRAWDPEVSHDPGLLCLDASNRDAMANLSRPSFLPFRVVHRPGCVST